MTNIDVYATQACPFCQRALALLDSKGAQYTVIWVDEEPHRREEMQTRAGRTSVPQIFFGETHVGGCDDLHLLEANSELDDLLAALNNN